MNKSESIKELAVAMAAFQGEIQNPKNSANNPFFNSKYAPLNDVLNLIRPLLAKHGLSVLQSPSGDGTNIIISTLIMHSSGEWIEPDPLILKADKPTAQGAGSAITYGRRYAISAIFGISSEDDDDGNHAAGNQPKPAPNAAKNKPTTPQKQTDPKPIDWPKFWQSVQKLGFTEAEVHIIAEADSLKDWSREKVDALYNELKTMKSEVKFLGDERQGAK